MRKKISLFLVMAIFLGLVACAGLQQKWDKATDDEKARIIVSQTQKSLKSSFILAKTFVDANPKYEAEWKAKVVPLYDLANKMLKDYIVKGMAGVKFTYLDVLSSLGSKTNEIQVILTGWGLKITGLEDIERRLAWTMYFGEQ